ncbi:isochorismatase family protein [Lampropedia puyangensis]|uniref:Isochorismatase family protein n=1 Tax=Lampropedia puyangensis TaxID=1330072 RepID=A0A4S8F4Q7_9BURK|nr:isochorismatase family protein [Lampropedia puyangensis]THU02009.1 isochorismatase family protein [Lampropedia puyangensis]
MALPSVSSYALPSAADLPAARAPWQLELHRAALLVHDMQEYFLRPFPANASPIAPVKAHIAQLVHFCRKHGVPVFYTAQQGDQLLHDRGLQAALWGPGMRAQPEHEAIAAEIAPHAEDTVLIKHRYSAFQRSPLEELLKARGRNQLLICGVYAHIGCQLTAAEAFQRDIEPFMVADALADFSYAHHIQALQWAAVTCAPAILTDQILTTERLAVCN